MTRTIGDRFRNWYHHLRLSPRRDAARQRGALPRLEHLDERILPDARPTLPWCFSTVLDHQHTDVNVNYNGGWVFGANNVDDTQVTPLDDTLLYLNGMTQGVQPAGSQWDFLGAGAGNTVWSIPQVRRPGELFLGFRSQETAAGTFASYHEDDPRVQSDGQWETVKLQQVLGPGTFSLFQTDPFGNPQTVWMSASQGNVHDTDKIFVPEGGHFDYNWAFSQPGVYQIVVKVSAFLETNPPTLTTSDDVTFNFAVVTPDTPPVHTTPGNVTTPFQTPFTFQNDTGISISTAEDHPCGIMTTLSVDAGTLTLSQTTGLTFLAGTGTNDQLMTVEGSVNDINAALEGMVYTPDNGFTGDAHFTITTDDMGRYAPYIDSMHTASNHQSTTDSFTITVLPGSAPSPSHGRPGAQEAAVGNALIFSAANGNAISVYNPASGSLPIQVTLSVSAGSLTLAQTTGLTFVTGTGTNDQTVTIQGTFADIDAALNGLTFNAPSRAGAVTFSMMTDDLNVTGTGNLTASDSFQINVM
jgi:surface-anchored protein